MKELKPCPFCGSAGEIVSGMDSPPTLEEYIEQEPNAKCSKPKCGGRYLTMSLSEWNTRPTPKQEGKVLVNESDLGHFHSLFYKMKELHQSFEVEEHVTGRYLGIYPPPKEETIGQAMLGTNKIILKEEK